MRKLFFKIHRIAIPRIKKESLPPTIIKVFLAGKDASSPPRFTSR